MSCERDEGYRRLTEIQLNDAKRFHKKLFGREWDGSSTEVATFASVAQDEDGQDGEEEHDASPLVNVFANIFMQLLGEGEIEDVVEEEE